MMTTFLEHFLQLYGAAALTWLAYEARQWRLWWMQQHGGAPDSEMAREKDSKK